MSYRLELTAQTEESLDVLKPATYKGDLGYDLVIYKDIQFKPNETVKIDLNVKAKVFKKPDILYFYMFPVIFSFMQNYFGLIAIILFAYRIFVKQRVGFFVFPRSSIYKTPLRLSNNVAVIDTYYDGNLCLLVDNIKNEPYTLKKGTSIAQIVAGNMPITDMTFYDKDSQVITIRSPNLDRNDRGFGSSDDFTTYDDLKID